MQVDSASNQGVVLVEQLSPSRVAELDCLLRGSHEIREQDRQEQPLRPLSGSRRCFAHEPHPLADDDDLPLGIEDLDIEDNQLVPPGSQRRDRFETSAIGQHGGNEAVGDVA